MYRMFQKNQGVNLRLCFMKNSTSHNKHVSFYAYFEEWPILKSIHSASAVSYHLLKPPSTRPAILMCKHVMQCDSSAVLSSHRHHMPIRGYGSFLHHVWPWIQRSISGTHISVSELETEKEKAFFLLIGVLEDRNTYVRCGRMRKRKTRTLLTP